MSPRKYYRRRQKDIDPRWEAAIAIACIIIIIIYFIVLQFRLLANSWPLIVGLAIVAAVISVAVKLLIGFIRREQAKALDLSQIDEMSGFEFETYVQQLLKHQGFQSVSLTARGADFGADLLATKEKMSYAIQVKRYKGLVGIDAIYQIIGGKGYYHRDKAMVITNSHFTDAAQAIAKETGVELIDRDGLSNWIIEFQKPK